jgi:hypothetical protein
LKQESGNDKCQDSCMDKPAHDIQQHARGKYAGGRFAEEGMSQGPRTGKSRDGFSLLSRAQY